MLFFLLTLSTMSGVFSVPAASVSVMKGDSVTLNFGVAIAPQEDVKWYFNDIRIAQINGDHSFKCTDVQCSKDNERFRDRVKVDHQTGSLTIRNTTTEDSGEYQLKIIESSNIREKNFNVTVYSSAAVGLCVSDAVDVEVVKAISVKEGESVTLDSRVQRKTCDMMTWFFNNTLIAKDPSTVCLNAQCEEEKERFRNRLKLDNQTGSLTITNTRTTDSGEYKLKISCQMRSRSIGITSLKLFNVTVAGLAPSSASARGIWPVVVVLLLLATVIACLICCYKHRARKQDTGMCQFSMGQRRRLKESSTKLSETTSTDATNDTSHNVNMVEKQ